MTHGGSGYRYVKGCRCNVCRAANRVRVKRRRAERYAQTAQEGLPPSVRHGTCSAHTNWGCRCVACVEATSAKLRQRRAKACAARVLVDGCLVAPESTHGHGHPDTYQRFGCRCELCRQALATARRST